MAQTTLLFPLLKSLICFLEYFVSWKCSSPLSLYSYNDVANIAQQCVPAGVSGSRMHNHYRPRRFRCPSLMEQLWLEQAPLDR